MKKKYILFLYKKGMLKEILKFYKVGAKGVKMEIINKVYAYILSMVERRLRVENATHFFVHDSAPSMDREYYGDIATAKR
jgi:hypothetical protein